MNTEYRIIFSNQTKTGLLSPILITSVLRRIAATFGGYTLLSGKGAYLAEDGSLSTEPSHTLVILAESAEYPVIQDFASQIKALLKQESVLITRYPVETEFL